MGKAHSGLSVKSVKSVVKTPAGTCPWNQSLLTSAPTISKIQPDAEQHRSLSGQVGVEVDRVQMVVLRGQGEQAHGDLGPPLREVIAGQGIELPKMIPC